MRTRVTDNNNKDPFALIRMMSERPLFKDCPVKPPESTIETAEDMYLKFCDKPDHVSAYDEYVILEWYYPSIKKPKMLKELVVKDDKNMEWRVYNY